VPNSAALRQGPHIKVAAVANRWQRVRDLVSSVFEPHSSRTRSRRLITFTTAHFVAIGFSTTEFCLFGDK